MLDFIYYPVSWILWFWHKAFGFIFGEASGISWMLGIIFLVWTLRLIMFKPFVNQVRSMRKMQEFAPEMKKIQKKYANDRQRQAQEMQKLQREHGFNPLGGCLPMLLQIPVFIGLFHVLRSFGNSMEENYGFGPDGVKSYLEADLFGAGLSNFITQPAELLSRYGADSRTAVIIVSIPLMVLASVLTHLTARHSVARQNPESAGTPQTAIMNKVMLYLFPIGIPIGAAIFPFPIGLLIYWLANNAWTLMQQAVVYRKIDREDEEKKTAAKEKRNTLAPKPGQKPTQKKRPATRPAVSDVAKDGSEGEQKQDDAGSGNGSATPKKTVRKPTAGPGAKPQPGAKPARKPPAGAKPQPGAKPANNKPTEGGTEIPGLISDRSRSRKSGRKNR